MNDTIDKTHFPIEVHCPKGHVNEKILRIDEIKRHLVDGTPLSFECGEVGCGEKWNYGEVEMANLRKMIADY